ncbi:MAG TPA: hypothetical protein VET85_11755 [Stellaceae bacterium]|nr:hypothetical protein [Stellaceae bacterium]
MTVIARLGQVLTVALPLAGALPVAALVDWRSPMDSAAAPTEGCERLHRDGAARNLDRGRTEGCARIASTREVRDGDEAIPRRRLHVTTAVLSFPAAR